MATVTLPAAAIPGPRGLPLIGGRLGMIGLLQSPFSRLRHMHDTYGDLVALARGDSSYIMAFGPALNHQILSRPELFINQATTLVRAPKNSAMERLFFNNLTTMNGPHHKQQRRLIQPAFHKQSLLNYHNDMIMLTQAMLDRWQPGAELSLLPEMQHLTQRIAVKTLFGLYDEAELTRVGTLLHEALAMLAKPQVLIAQINLPGMPFYRANKLFEQLEAFILAQIAQKRTQPDATDMLAALVHARDEDGDQLSDLEMISHAFTLFIAGHETTSDALTWTLFLLDQHPQVAAALLDELEHTLHGEPPTIEHIRPDNHSLPLLEGVIKESLRLLPPALVGMRVAAAPCELAGYELPKGTTVLYSEFITHRLPELYEEPDRFKPERWATLHRSLYEYIPFSAGPHMCIGAGFAMQELKVVLAMLLQRYRLAIVPGSKISVNFRMRPLPSLPMRIFAQDGQFQRAPVLGQINEVVQLNS